MIPVIVIMGAATLCAAWRLIRPPTPDPITRLLTRILHQCPPPDVPRPDREPPPSPLTPSEQAHLAMLATRYAHGDPHAGWHLADHLRRHLPGVPDLTIMRCVILLRGVAMTFSRNELTATDALAKYLHRMDAAALQLSTFTRDEIPR